jgi:hypothetical protein
MVDAGQIRQNRTVWAGVATARAVMHFFRCGKIHLQQITGRKGLGLSGLATTVALTAIAHAGRQNTARVEKLTA